MVVRGFGVIGKCPFCWEEPNVETVDNTGVDLKPDEYWVYCRNIYCYLNDWIPIKDWQRRWIGGVHDVEEFYKEYL